MESYGKQKKRWEDNIVEWTGLSLGDILREAENREMERIGCQIISGALMVNQAKGLEKIIYVYITCIIRIVSLWPKGYGVSPKNTVGR